MGMAFAEQKRGTKIALRRFYLTGAFFGTLNLGYFLNNKSLYPVDKSRFCLYNFKQRLDVRPIFTGRMMLYENKKDPAGASFRCSDGLGRVCGRRGADFDRAGARRDDDQGDHALAEDHAGL
jgi:hypothetical protein